MIRKTLLRLLHLFVFAGLPLYATAKTPNATQLPPPSDGPVQVEFSTNPVSKWTDLPLGTYRVPNSDVIISGHQKSGAGMLFGVVGVMVQNAVQAHNGKEEMANAEQVLTISIDEEAKALLQAEVADPAFAGKYTSEAGSARKFEVTGAVVMSFSSYGQVLPYVVLRVKLLDKGGSKLWTTRYIASGGARKSLVGEGSWTAADGGLRLQVSALLKTAIHTMLKDISSPYPRDSAQMVTVRGFFPHVNKPIQVVGYKLAEENGRMYFLPNLGTTIVFGGVNVLDTNSVSVAPTVRGDKLRLLKLGEWVQPGQPATATATATAPAEGAAAETGEDAGLPAENAADAEAETEAEQPAKTGG
jgi:hypothetical protein